jgi:hypothetical protein
MKYAIEAWIIAGEGDEEPYNSEMEKSEVFDNLWQAQDCAWCWMEEGFFVRLWRR